MHFSIEEKITQEYADRIRNAIFRSNTAHIGAFLHFFYENNEVLKKYCDE